MVPRIAQQRRTVVGFTRSIKTSEPAWTPQLNSSLKLG
jgi:hypothetical protein